MTFVPQSVVNQQWIMDAFFVPLTKEGYKKNAAVYACIRIISQSLGEPPIIYTKRTTAIGDEEEEVEPSKELRELLEYPNEMMTQFEMLELMATHMCICGSTYWWKERANSGKIKALWPLRPDRVSPLYANLPVEGERVIRGWVYHTPGSGEVIQIPSKDVLFINFPDPLGESGGMVEGLGPLQVLAREVSADNEATKFTGAILANYAQPGWAIQVKAAIQDEAEARLIKMKFQSEFGGAHRGEPAVFDADTTITKLSFTMTELEMPSLREFSESRIAAAFGVPAMLVGLKVGLAHSTYSNIQEARRDFTERTLELWWRRIEDVFNRDLVQEIQPRLRARFDRTSVLALVEARISHAEPIRTAWGSNAATLNEYRTAIGLKPDPDRGDMYKLMADIVLETAANQMTQPPPPEEAAGALPPQDPEDPYGLFGDLGVENAGQPALPAPAGQMALPAGGAATQWSDDQFPTAFAPPPMKATSPEELADQARALYGGAANELAPALSKALARQAVEAAVQFMAAMKESDGAS
jgi:HK97 family phage portal protein